MPNSENSWAMAYEYLRTPGFWPCLEIPDNSCSLGITPNEDPSGAGVITSPSLDLGDMLGQRDGLLGQEGPCFEDIGAATACNAGLPLNEHVGSFSRSDESEYFISESPGTNPGRIGMVVGARGSPGTWSSPSILSSPLNVVSCMSLSPEGILGDNDHGMELNTPSSHNQSPTPRLPIPPNKVRGSGSRKRERRGRKPIGETSRERRKRTKPEKCSHPGCDMGFATSRDRNRHMQIHDRHRELFECMFCKKHFTLKWSLDRHNKNHHPESSWPPIFDGFECM